MEVVGAEQEADQGADSKANQVGDQGVRQVPIRQLLGTIGLEIKLMRKGDPAPSQK